MIWRNDARSVACSAVGLLSLAVAGIAAADAPVVTMDFFASGCFDAPVPMDIGTGELQWDGYWLWEAQEQGDANPWFNLDWHLASLDRDPGREGEPATVTAQMSVTNLSDEYQQFAAMVTVALDGPVGPLCAMNGDVTASVTNTSFYGDAELRTYTFGPEAGAPIYMAMIDEVDQQSMWDAPYSLVADGPYATNADDMAFGEPEPLIGPGANSLISVLLRIELSPHDTANVVGTFEIAPIPGPAALPAFGLLGLVAQRRRRRA